MIIEAASEGSQIVVLPAFFNAPYDLERVKEVAQEVEPIQTQEKPYDLSKENVSNCSSFLSTLAKFLKIHIIGGAIFEKQNDKLYVTCLCFDDQGNLKLRYRKLHILGSEEQLISPGSQFGLFETPFAKFGIGICEDIRFIQYPLILSEKLGANFLCFPAHFSSITGPLQYPSLARSRCIDAQCFLAMASTCPNQSGSEPYGHSMIIDPWGKVLEDAGVEEKVIMSSISLERVMEVKQSLRYATQKRKDVYMIKTPALE